MPTERHAAICQIIDKSLAGVAMPEEERTLREHLVTCTQCSEYLEASNRAIAGLDGFRFEMDPALESKVMASVAARAQQLEAKHTQRGRLRRWSWLAAVALTVIGSFTALQLGGIAAPVFHVAPAQLQVGLTAFWIVPSFFVCLLFLLLPARSVSRGDEKGFSL
jgi:predicted anti-sigma-YlaC factor YlaD